MVLFVSDLTTKILKAIFEVCDTVKQLKFRN